MRQLTVDAGRLEHELATARTWLVTVNREINNSVGVIAQVGLNSLGTIKDARDGQPVAAIYPLPLLKHGKRRARV